MVRFAKDPSGEYLNSVDRHYFDYGGESKSELTESEYKEKLRQRQLKKKQQHEKKKKKQS